MGGFMLFDGNEPVYPLTPEAICTLSKGGYINFPDITEKEINDRSKGGVLSKCLVLLQTGWFVMQCIARGVERLPVTELELVTVAFATLNFVTYLFWWDKPLNVRRPFRILLEKSIADKQKGARDREKDVAGWLTRVVNVTTGLEDEVVDLATEKRVPTFYAGDLRDDQRFVAAVGSAVIAMIFGGIHCIAWSFSFPTLAEKILWRVSSIAIIGVPFFYVAFFGLIGLCNHLNLELPIVTAVIAIITIPTALLLYFVARTVLLVQAFVTLRSPSPGVFQTVHWTTFIPHI